MNKKIIIAGLVVLLLCSISFMGFEQVNAGHRGIKLVWGKVASESLPEGLYFYNRYTPAKTNNSFGNIYKRHSTNNNGYYN